MDEKRRKVAKSNQSAGNRHEREVAKRTGGVQVGDRGGCDVVTPFFHIECKKRAKIPAELKKFMAQAISNAKDKIPMVILHEGNTHYKDDYLILRVQDAIELGMFEVEMGMPPLNIPIKME